MKPTITTRKTLDDLKCDCCGEEEQEIYFHPKCHKEAPTWTVYYGGMLKVICAECEKTVVIIEVK